MFKKQKAINDIINFIINNGSEIDYAGELTKDALKLFSKDFGLVELLNIVANDVKNQTEEFLNKKNKFGVNYISSISSCIYLPDFNGNGEYKLKLIGGNRGRNINLKIDENTLFDVASITKLYTLLLTFKMSEYGFINLTDKIVDVNPDFSGLEDFTFNDLIRLHGDLRTYRNITEVNTYEDAYTMLKTLYLKSNTREENKYTDFGAIVIGDTISKILSKEIGRTVSFDKIMNAFLLEPLNLKNTMFNPNTDNVSGNGRFDSLVHDPKSRILGGAVGNAGIFTTSDDLARLAKELYSVNYVNFDYLRRLGEVTFPGAKQSNKGNLGGYVKHPKGYDMTFTPLEYSTGSFSYQGWTGSVAMFDPYNKIHQNTLVNAIYEDDNKDLVKNDKPVGFMNAFVEYQKNITKNVMLMYVVKFYYNMYCGVKENIDNTKFIK